MYELNQQLVDFEAFVGLAPTRAHLLLGIAYITYAHYRSGKRQLPGYHARHIATIGMMSRRQIHQLIDEVSNGCEP